MERRPGSTRSLYRSVASIDPGHRCATPWRSQRVVLRGLPGPGSGSVSPSPSMHPASTGSLSCWNMFGTRVCAQGRFTLRFRTGFNRSDGETRTRSGQLAAPTEPTGRRDGTDESAPAHPERMPGQSEVAPGTRRFPPDSVLARLSLGECVPPGAQGRRTPRTRNTASMQIAVSTMAPPARVWTLGTSSKAAQTQIGASTTSVRVRKASTPAGTNLAP